MARGKGEGSVYRLSDGRWAFAIIKNGRRSIVTAKSRPEALRKGEQLKGSAGASREFLSDYLKQWLDRKDNIREKTRDFYKWAINGYLVPDLGRVKLKNLDASSIEDTYAEWKRRGKSAAVIKKAHVVLSTALGDAERLGLIPSNPCRKVRPPTVRRKDPVMWSPAQLRKFRRGIRGHKFYAFFLLLLTTGLRPSEAFALPWRNVDLKNRVLRVTRSLQNVGGKRSFEDVKRPSSRRSVTLPNILVEALSALPRTSDLVFHDTKGGALQKDTFRSRVWNPLLEELKLPKARMYDLRHMANSIVLELNVNPIVARERIGHASSRTTQDTYGHILPGIQHDVADRIEAFLMDDEEQESD